MKKIISLWIFTTYFLIAQSPNFDFNIEISTLIDTTQVKIGEEINFKIDIYSKNEYNIRFDENPNFMPFEILKSYFSFASLKLALNEDCVPACIGFFFNGYRHNLA